MIRPPARTGRTRDHVAGDRIRGGAREVGDGLGDIHRLATLVQRVDAAAHLAVGQRDGGGHLGLDEARGYGIDGDALLGQRWSQCLGDADHAGLGGAVVGLAAVAGDTGDGGQPDDPATLANGAVSDEALGKALRRKQIDGDHGVPARIIHVLEELVAGDTGVVDQDVGLAAVVLLEMCGDGVDRIFGGDVQRQRGATDA